MPGRVTAPNVVTCGNITAGVLALVAVENGRPLTALGLVMVAAMCDVLDGWVARRGAGETEFGGNLDSLADVISFGVVPALALYLGPLQPLPVLGIGGCLGFVLAGAWRLARYPLVKDCAAFVGLPIPLAGMLAMLLVVLDAPFLLALGVTVSLSVLMVSSVAFPTVGTVLRRTRGARRPRWWTARRRALRTR